MKEADGTIYFKEWLPDLPDLDNPGLVEADNCRWVDGLYQDFRPLARVTGSSGTAMAAVNGTPHSGIYAYTGGAADIYAASVITSGSSQIYRCTSSFFSGSWVTASATIGATVAGFAQYGNLVIAAVEHAAQPCFVATAGSSTFATLGSTAGNSPGAYCVGIVNQFVVLGAVATPPQVRWSGINAPLSWPTPSSATAIAQQSGAQTMNQAAGFVSAIAGGDQHGIVFQSTSITRMTYIGGSTVFQFDMIDNVNGTPQGKSVVQVGDLCYFGNETGFFVTDGVTVKDISKNRVSRYFLDRFNGYGDSVRGALDEANRLIYWSFGTSSNDDDPNDRLLIYNYAEDKWSSASQTMRVFITGQEFPSGAGQSGPYRPYAFTSAQTLSSFSGTAGTATLTVGEGEWSRGGFSRVQGVKPLVDVTANAVTVAIGTRNDQATTPSYTSEVTANSRSGFCDFRSEARYHRARLTITGTFNAAQGLEFQVEPSGPV